MPYRTIRSRYVVTLALSTSYDGAAQLRQLLGIHRILADKTLSRCTSRRVSLHYYYYCSTLKSYSKAPRSRYGVDILTALGQSTAVRSRANNLFLDGNRSLVLQLIDLNASVMIYLPCIFSLCSSQCNDVHRHNDLLIYHVIIILMFVTNWGPTFSANHCANHFLANGARTYPPYRQ